MTAVLEKLAKIILELLVKYLEKLLNADLDKDGKIG